MNFLNAMFSTPYRRRRQTFATPQQLEERCLLSGTPLLISTESEPNNTLQTADSLGSTSSLTPTANWQLTGSLGLSDTADYFRFTLHERSELTVTLTNMTQNLRLQLLGSFGEPIRESNRSGTQSEAIKYTLSAGTYFIKVESGPKSPPLTSYQLNLTSIVQLRQDQEESNDTTAKATNLGSIGTSIVQTRTDRNLGYGSDFNDYYKFTVSNRLTASGTISLSNLKDDLQLEITGPKGFVLRSTNSGTTSETLNLSSLTPGTYYVRVFQATTGIASSYDLSFSLSADPTMDFNGVNNSKPQAINLGKAGTSPVITTKSEKIGFASDVADYYSFEVAAGRKSKFKLDLTFLSGLPANLGVVLMNSSGHSISLSETKSGNQRYLTLSSAAARLASGTYYIVFTSSAVANLDYRFTLRAETQLA